MTGIAGTTTSVASASNAAEKSTTISLAAKFDLEAGTKAYHAGDFEKAFKEFQAAAEAGSPGGQHFLAALYYQGKGVDRDTAKAIELFKKAAAQNYPASLSNLGTLHLKGDGVEKDIEKALTYNERAFDAGLLASGFYLGQIYRMGREVDVDFEKARHWFQKAAEKGEPRSMHELGLLHVEGNGVEKNVIEGFAWLYASFTIAEDEKSLKNIEQLTRELPPDDLAVAQNRGRDYVTEYYGKPPRSNNLQ